jgi:hypothetical protein
MHSCFLCGRSCDCRGDIDDIDFGPSTSCTCRCDEGDEADYCGCTYEGCVCNEITQDEMCSGCREGVHVFESEPFEIEDHS